MTQTYEQVWRERGELIKKHNALRRAVRKEHKLLNAMGIAQTRSGDSDLIYEWLSAITHTNELVADDFVGVDRTVGKDRTAEVDRLVSDDSAKAGAGGKE